MGGRDLSRISFLVADDNDFSRKLVRTILKALRVRDPSSLGFRDRRGRVNDMEQSKGTHRRDCALSKDIAEAKGI